MTTKNTIKTAALLAALTALCAVAGSLLGGSTGMLVAVLFALIMNAGAYWFSDRLALAMARAHPIGRTQAPGLYAMIEDLSMRGNLPMPKVYVIDQASPNAFATGRNPSHAAVAVTTGILGLLEPRELYGVLAHELAHIKHRDILIASVAAALGGAITALATVFQFTALFGHDDGDDEGGGLGAALAMIFLAPIAATVIQLAVSRTREFAADAGGAQLAGDPLALAGALRKLESGTWLKPMHLNPATAPLYIVNPITGRGISRLFQTHPPMADRIARLEALAARQPAGATTFI
jgi:heat shock protein HtpX